MDQLAQILFLPSSVQAYPIATEIGMSLCVIGQNQISAPDLPYDLSLLSSAVCYFRHNHELLHADSVNT